MNELARQLSGLSGDRRELLERLLRKEGVDVRQLPIARQKRELSGDPPSFALSFGQERLLFLEQLGLVGAAYNESSAVRLRGWVDVAALTRSFITLIGRHEILRTRFATVNGQPFQVVEASVEFSLAEIDLEQVSVQEREDELRRIMREVVTRPFDLSAVPLWSAHLLRLSECDHVLLIRMHHIISDDWSVGVIIKEVGALYSGYVSGRAVMLPELPVQYADYAVWQRGWLTGEALDRQVGYWKEQLAGAPAALELPSDRPRPPVQSFRGARHGFALSPELSSGLLALSRQEGATLYMVLLAAFSVLLGRYSGQEDIVVGSPIAGRRRQELEGLIGFFVNTLVVRTDLSGDPTFRALLQRVKETALAAYAHQDLPFEKLVEELQPVRDLSRQPLFQVGFTLQNAPQETLDLPGLRLSQVGSEQVATKRDLSLLVHETPSGLQGSVEYATDLFDRGTIERLVGHFETLLAGIVASPGGRLSELPLLGEAERHRLLVEWNDTAAEYPHDKCLHELFGAQAERTPDAVAVVFEDQQLTYGELERRANQLAHHLRGLGVGPEVVVGLCIERSLEMVVGLLGILKAGGAYLPLDPSYPQERLAYMLTDARAPVLVTQAGLVEQLPEHDACVVQLDADWAEIATRPMDAPASGAKPGNIAYLLYTSGSTGRPKGVLVEHCRVANYIWAIRDELELDEVASYLLVQPLAVDSSVTVLYGALLLGGALHLVSYATSLDAARLADYTSRHAIDCLKIAPPHLQSMINSVDGAKILPKKLLIVGGDVSHWEWIERLSGLARGCRIFNHYGPTETTVGVTTYAIYGGGEHGSTGSVPIGRALSNTQVYILDARLQPVPIGVIGDLYIGGVPVVRGYLGKAALTAESFIPDPFTTEAGGRLYRARDRARYLSDGSIEFLGRDDDQVKIHGFRVEVEEIASVLTEHHAIGQAVVVATGDKEKSLVAYLVFSKSMNATPAELRHYLAGRLPRYMIPSAFVVLDALPRTRHGKVDRGALPAPEGRPEVGAYVAARTPVEEALCSIWREVLRLERVGVNDNFFELGGHSLIATAVIARLRDVFTVELPLRILFEAPTVRGLAERIEQAQREGAEVSLPPLVMQPRGEALPLSYAQERLWFLEQLGVGSAYNMPAALRLEGVLDIAALERSLGDVVRRHESLRTRFEVVDGQGFQVIDEPGGFRLDVVDLSGLEDEQRQAQARRLAREDAERPFDLAAGQLFRAGLLRLGPREHVALVNMHHIVSDGWSLGVLIREIGALYSGYVAGRASPLPELPVQYADYAIWQRGWLTGEALDRQVGYWKEQLAGAPAALELPSDRPRPAVQSFRGADHSFELSRELSSALLALARQEGATLYMVLLAAFSVLLGRYSGQKDIVVGSPIAARRHELEGLIGFFVNALVLRTDLSGDPTFRGLLQRVKETALGAYAHQDLPFEKLVEELHPARDLSRQPLFQVLLDLQNVPQETLDLPGLQLSQLGSEQVTTKFDLSLFIHETASGLQGSVEYATDLFDRGTIERLVAHFETLLMGIVATPESRLSELPLLRAAERHRLLVEWNDTAAEYPHDKCLHELFSAQAERTPDAVAVVFEDQQLTYAELERRSNQLAHHLRGLGVGPEVVVGLCVERSLEMVVGLLGILKAGGAYLPLDPSYPQERLAYMLTDANVPVVVTQAALVEQLPVFTALVVRLDADWNEIEREPTSAPANDANPDNLAYVIYTSGSSGRPKAAMIRHGGVINYLDYAATNYDAIHRHGAIVSTPLSFDATVTSLFTPLVRGQAVRLLPEEDEVEALATILDKERNSWLLKVTPAHLDVLRQLLPAPAIAEQACLAVIGGEALMAETVQPWREHAPGTRMFNEYGPTETVVGCAVYEINTETAWTGAIPIGRPISNTRVYVLDSVFEPVPIGVSGELYIGGVGLARGYLNRPDLTAERFVPSPFGEGERLYRTGDLARYLADGNLEFLGRIDHQVKVRGYRIELGEVETALASHAGVGQAVVVAREDAPGDKRLVAYVVGAGDDAPDVSAMRAYLRNRLPDYMVPSAIVALEALPLTPNGKVDRGALPAPEGRPEVGAYVAARTPVEEALCSIWREVLRLERVGVNDNFFELGGDSILSIQISTRANWAGFKLSVRDIFEHQTVAGLATVAGAAASALVEQGVVQGVVPLTPI